LRHVCQCLSVRTRFLNRNGHAFPQWRIDISANAGQANADLSTVI
jgi:hypothetical protein